MKIIISIKPTATLARIEQLSAAIENIKYDTLFSSTLPFYDVIESVSMEK